MTACRIGRGKNPEECETGTRKWRWEHKGRSGDERWQGLSVIEEQWKEQREKEEAEKEEKEEEEIE